MLNTRYRAPLALALLLAFSGLAQANEPSVQTDSRQLTAGRDAAAYSVRISYPDGRVAETHLLAGESMPIDAASPGGMLADGQYNYEFVPITGVMRRSINDVPRAGERLRPSQPARSGTFRVVGGRVIAPEQQPISITDQDYGVSLKHQLLEADGERSAAAKDQVIPDDLIVQSSICVGFDCVNNESFGFDTLRLKENNTRLNFEDTSTGTFPANDWTLIANDSASGGSNYFAIEDRNAARQIFRVTAGAPANALFVDSTGRIGLRTSTPVLDMHISTSNTPGIRLEQTSAGGFTAQSWDVAGNEANFFIRDVTGGSRLPFRIRPGAPTSSLDVASSGAVGMGIASPAARLHVEVPSGLTSGDTLLLKAPGVVRIGMMNSQDGSAWSFNAAGPSTNPVLKVVARNASGVGLLDALTIEQDGDVIIAGTLTQNSNVHSKQNFRQVDGPEILAMLRELDVTRWNFKSDPGTDHIGPMAQDFYAVFGLGNRSDRIAPLDTSGVALAAIKALQEELDARDALIEKLEARITALENAR